ncbi:hypothetical protein BU16DRAFT_584733 [Lophium mytilinum]|uniref:Peptidase C14 n=1 Tax=Lophium mytilinum TaxID=390894 RepID=A0A6A6QGC4_9PEZI|nr:hypothetical protein BU16DRAFT_584733 [Lophium mytilinum]
MLQMLSFILKEVFKSQERIRTKTLIDKLEDYTNQQIARELKETSPVDNTESPRSEATHEYESVRVVLLGWQQSDIKDLSRELYYLEYTFEHLYRYETYRYDMHNDNPNVNLVNFLGTNGFLPKSGYTVPKPEEKQLVIVVYGGHSDHNNEFAPYRHGNSALLRWKPVQMRLMQQHYDLLVIVDTCHAGQPIRSSASSKNMVLAACAAEESAFETGEFGYSFSKILNDELRAHAEQGLPVSIRALVHDRLLPMWQHGQDCALQHSIRPNAHTCLETILQSTPSCSAIPADDLSIDIVLAPLPKF